MLRSTLVLVALSTSAYAQAPSDQPQEPAPMAPPPAEPPPSPGPSPAAPGMIAPSARPSSVMSRRWAVGLSLGWKTLTAQTDGKPKVTFGILELTGRFRFQPPFELGLALVAGGTAGDHSTAGIYVDGRYRFLAERPWNVFVLGGLGIASAAHKDAAEQERRGRGSFRLGVGVERRFRVFALNAELQLGGISANRDVVPPGRTPTSYQLARYGQSAGSITVGGTFYF